MIIYYHCNSDNALLLSFLLTCHPRNDFLHQESCISELSHAHAQQKMTTDVRTRGRAMTFPWRYIYYVKSTKVLLVKSHIACPN